MAGAYLLVNPTLIFSGVRKDYFQVMSEQANLLTQGYAIAYPKGLGASITTGKERLRFHPLPGWHSRTEHLGNV